MDNSIIENKTSIQTNNFYNTTTFSFTRLLKLCFKTLLIFFYIYEFNLSVWGLPSFVTSRRIVVVVFVAIFIFKFLTKNEKIRIYHDFFHKKVNSLLLILFIFLCYVGFLLLTIGFGEGDTIVPDIIKLILFGVLPLSFLPSVFSSTEEFIKAILLATIAQAIIIILCQFVPTFCNFIDINFSTDYEYVITHRSTYAGGLACITAPGFFRFSMGLFACVYFICKSKKISYFIIYMILSFIGTMIARTGLIIAAIGMLLILFYSLTRGGYSTLIKMVISSIIIIVLAVVLLNNPNIQAYLGRTFIRLINLFNNG
ncbi:MAG: hypothetical protein GX638_07270, partial [Crenarchaeota archaeon]|nr:hypothetical protein [Thermoproteota archaeon]